MTMRDEEYPAGWWAFQARVEIAAGHDPAPLAPKYVAAIERLGYEWASDAIYDWLCPAEAIGMALIAGAGERAAAGYERIVRSVHDSGTLLVDLPPERHGALDATQLGWLRLLRRDWRPLDFRGPTDGEYPLIRDLLAAAASGDPARIDRAIERFVAVYEPVTVRSAGGRVAPSVLEYALRREIPRRANTPSPGAAGEVAGFALPGLPRGWFRAGEADETGARRLPAVVSSRVVALPPGRRDGAPHLVEQLACGHVRVEPAPAIGAGRRNCPFCASEREAERARRT